MPVASERRTRVRWVFSSRRKPLITRRVLWLATAILMLTSGLVLGQTTSTFNGRVLDAGDAVLPGVTITATNTNTGVVRTTVTNAEGGYLMPGLEPGTYSVKTELA